LEINKGYGCVMSYCSHMTPTDIQILSHIASICYGLSLELIKITLYTAQYT